MTCSAIPHYSQTSKDLGQRFVARQRPADGYAKTSNDLQIQVFSNLLAYDTVSIVIQLRKFLRILMHLSSRQSKTSTRRHMPKYAHEHKLRINNMQPRLIAAQPAGRVVFPLARNGA